MKPETEQKLATIEIILQKGLAFMPPYHEDGGYFKPYIWDSELQGIFSPLSLVKSKGWIQETDIEEAIKNWQWSEKTGIAAKGILNDGEPSCIENGEDEAEILLSEKTKLARAKIYQNIFEILSNKINSLQAFTFSCDCDYSLAVIVGQLSAQQWIAICPTVPQETPSYFNDEIICSSYIIENNTLNSDNDLNIEIENYIKQLGSIKTYGWYDGGYNQTHEYKIILAKGENKEIALENALLKSKLFEVYKFDNFNISEQLECYHDDKAEEIEIKSNQLNQFFNKTFSQVLLYRFCFWDVEHIYILGDASVQDRVGIVLHSQFTFNP